jgi:predicted transcriptional regulator
MSEFGNSSVLATQTLAEIAEIDRRIASLVELRDGLKRIFVGAQRVEFSDSSHPAATGSNRAVVEHIVVDMLSTTEGGTLKTRELFDGARTISTRLKYVTFRSYLHRLKKRGVIVAEDGAYGSWRLPPIGHSSNSD